MNKDMILSRLIKEYVIQNQNTTGRQISEHFVTHDFGLRRELNPNVIYKLVTKYNANYRWFNVQPIRKGSGYRYICK